MNDIIGDKDDKKGDNNRSMEESGNIRIRIATAGEPEDEIINIGNNILGTREESKERNYIGIIKYMLLSSIASGITIWRTTTPREDSRDNNK